LVISRELSYKYNASTSKGLAEQVMRLIFES
jgi:hypothetical protein